MKAALVAILLLGLDLGGEGASGGDPPLPVNSRAAGWAEAWCQRLALDLESPGYPPVRPNPDPHAYLYAATNTQRGAALRATLHDLLAPTPCSRRPRLAGRCSAKLDDRNGNVTCVYTGRVIRRAFEPRNEHKGNVARTLFYFAVRYDRPLRPWQEKALRGWNALDPPDADEVARTNNIELVDGTRNPLSTTPSTSIGSTTSKACHAPSALLPSIGDRHLAAGGKGQRRGGVPRATSAQGPPPARRKVRASRCPVRLDRHLPAPCVGHALAGPSRR